MAQDIWSLRVWQRALRDFFVMALNEGKNETVFFTTDNQGSIVRLGPNDAAPDLRVLLSVPTTKIRPIVRAEIRRWLTEGDADMCNECCAAGECFECDNREAAQASVIT